MKRNANVRLALAATAMFSAALALAGCKNAIADEVATMQEGAVAPIIAVLANETALENKGSLAFGLVSVGGESSIKLTIANKGVDPLKIDVDKIALTPGSSTAAGIFSIAAAPAAAVKSGTSTSITIRFAPDAETSEAASLVIPTNDIETPSFTCSLTGSGLGVSLNTAAVSSVAYTAALSGGTVSSTGGKTIVERGICWGTSPDPTISDNKRADAGTGLGSFSCSISPILPGIYYYVRAYATTSTGATAYGLSQSFTSTAATAPTTATVTAINAKSATAGFTAVADASLTLIECGVCWSTDPNPIATGSHQAGTSGVSMTLSGLGIATAYRIRAYAVLSNGSATTTVYGAEKGFKTVGYTGPSGGCVFYDRGEVIDGWRYLEAAPSDIGPYYYGPEVSIATGTGIGTGSKNTYDLFASDTYNYAAAAYCYDAVYGGKDDFFLPSKDELSLMMNNLSANSLGDIPSHPYWSSSASSTTAAYYQTNVFTSGTYAKLAFMWVRAIRQYR